MSFVHSTLAELEDRFNFETAHEWFTKNWTASFYASALYAATIFGLSQWMKDKTKGYDVRRWLFMWSTGLAIFSIMGCSIGGGRLWSAVFKEGFMSTLCLPRRGDAISAVHLARNRYGMWSLCFVLSKIVELGDTYFIILKKQQLIFLHWYHHITVLLYTWLAYSEFTAVNQWFLWINYAVHSVMYTYYSIRASGFYRPPIWINMFITILQIFQMVVGLALSIYVYLNIGDPNWDCDSNSDYALQLCYISFAMYFSYFLLFVHFFLGTYIFSSKKKSDHKSPMVTTDTCKMMMNGHVKCD